ncbi:MAG: FAD binding domain-containing protein [Caldisericia bacterium]|jgi:CO/xanthine dehydrogenase FAD-binding subunit|nr:FAD binding domain-containing protein [Caldisericia bacterium]
MLKNVREWFYPESIEEAYELIKKYDLKGEIVGGGLDIVWRDRSDIECLIFLEKIPLNYIKIEDSSIKIGATTTIGSIERCGELKNFLRGSFINSISKVATPILRNIMTVGGTIARGYGWSDILTIFITLKSKIKIYYGAYKTISLEEFIDFKKENKKFIIVEIEFPNFNSNYFFSYIRFTRTSADIPLLNEGVLLKISDGVIQEANILLGGRPNFPVHLKKIEEYLINKKLDDENINYVKEFIDVPLFDDLRASKEYRMHLSKVLTKRNLEKIKEEIC